MRVCLYSFWNKNEYLINKIRKREKYSLFHKSLQVIYSNVQSENLIVVFISITLQLNCLPKNLFLYLHITKTKEYEKDYKLYLHSSFNVIMLLWRWE